MVNPYFYQTKSKKIIGIVIIYSCNRSCGPSDYYRSGKCGINGCIDKPGSAKYSHIDNSDKGITTFLSFVRKKFPSATHINFYDPEFITGKNFIDRITL